MLTGFLRAPPKESQSAHTDHLPGLSPTAWQEVSGLQGGGQTQNRNVHWIRAQSIFLNQPPIWGVQLTGKVSRTAHPLSQPLLVGASVLRMGERKACVVGELVVKWHIKYAGYHGLDGVSRTPGDEHLGLNMLNKYSTMGQ